MVLAKIFYYDRSTVSGMFYGQVALGDVLIYGVAAVGAGDVAQNAAVTLDRFFTQQHRLGIIQSHGAEFATDALLFSTQ